MEGPLAGNPRIKWCATRGCGRALRCEDYAHATAVECLCGFKTCFTRQRAERRPFGGVGLWRPCVEPPQPEHQSSGGLPPFWKLALVQKYGTKPGGGPSPSWCDPTTARRREYDRQYT